MQRDILLLTEMVDAAEQAGQLTAGITVSQLETDRQRRDALLWNFTVLGEASSAASAAPAVGRGPVLPRPGGRRRGSRSPPGAIDVRTRCSSLINWEEFGRSSSG